MPRSDDLSLGTSGTARCQLICVPPGRVAGIWPRVSGMILAAMRRGDISSFRSVESSVLAGDALLWLAWDGGGDEVDAAAVTEIAQTEWRRVCVIVACGGSDMSRWIGLIEPIEQFARAQGCSAMRIVGRKGWLRALADYRLRRVVLEKEL